MTVRHALRARASVSSQWGSHLEVQHKPFAHEKYEVLVYSDLESYLCVHHVIKLTLGGEKLELRPFLSLRRRLEVLNQSSKLGRFMDMSQKRRVA